MIATTLVQSRHLLELGLDPSTADMHWFDIDGYNPHKNDWRLMCGHCAVEDCGKGLYVPAWSLSALLDVMPKGSELVKMQNDAHELYYEVDYMFTGYEDNDPVTAVYEMICWLLERELQKKGE